MDNELFTDLMQSLKEAVAISQGEMPPSRVFVVERDGVNVRTVREKTGLSQSEFARLLRVSPKTLQNWEQHRRTPSGPAAALLTLADRAPEMVLSTLQA